MISFKSKEHQFDEHMGVFLLKRIIGKKERNYICIHDHLQEIGLEIPIQSLENLINALKIIYEGIE